jgi:hypothetical protein
MRNICIIAAISVLALVHSAQAVNITSTPNLGSTNMFKNPTVENAAKETVRAWNFQDKKGGAVGDWTTASSHSPSHSLHIKIDNADYSGAWIGASMLQSFKPGESMLVSWWQNLPQGRSQFFLFCAFKDGTNTNNSVFYSSAGISPLSPNFVRNKKALPDLPAAKGWQRCRLTTRPFEKETVRFIPSFILMDWMAPDTDYSEIWFDDFYAGVPTVLLSVDASGEPVERAVITDDLGEVVFDSGEMAPSTSYKKEIPISADMAFVTVSLTRPDGKVVKFRHPEN